MSWNTTLGIIVDTRLDELGLTGEAVAYDLVEAPEVGAAQIGRHVVVVDRDQTGAEIKEIATALGRKAYLVTLSAYGNSYTLEAFGPISRLRTVAGGQVVAEQGAPLPAEAAGAGAATEESAHLAIVEALLGTGIAAVTGAEYQVWAGRAMGAARTAVIVAERERAEPVAPAAEPVAKRKRKFFGRS